MSRHVNLCLNKHSVQLDDLRETEAMRRPGEYIGIFDLENQYFHVQLAEGAKEIFGFARKDRYGIEKFYHFKIMVYGFAAAVVTRLIKPAMGFLHQEGIKTSIYMDDGNVEGATAEETEQHMQFTVKTMQLSGWNMQWSKTTLQAAQSVKYLGFVINLKNFVYEITPGKMEAVLTVIHDLLKKDSSGMLLDLRELAKVVGTIIALRNAHGSVVGIATKNLQDRLGKLSNTNGWDSKLRLRTEDRAELLWLAANLPKFNGHGIRNETKEDLHSSSEGQVVHAEDVGLQVIVSNVQRDWAEQGDLYMQMLDSKSFTEGIEYPEGVESNNLRAAVQELDHVAEVVKRSTTAGTNKFWRRMWWRTSSRNCFVWLKRGARNTYIRDRLLGIKWAEKANKICIVLLWVTKCPLETYLADSRSKQTTSTDEWGVDRSQLQEAFKKLNVQPTLDCFASSCNRVCERFFAKWPQIGASAVNFLRRS
jgi:hypothetical protein